MTQAWKIGCLLGVGLAALAAAPNLSLAQSGSLPNPYREDAGWAKPGIGRNFGSTIGLHPAPDGKGIWVFDRCGGNTCEQSNIHPITYYDESGRAVRALGARLFNRPHGFFVDGEGNLWATDQIGTPPRNNQPGKGHTVMKLSPEGRVLMTLGTPGVAGNDESHFNAPTDVLVAPNGDIFVSDGHGDGTNARIVKFDRTGKFIKAWGKEGSGPGEFNEPHGLAMDTQGRLFVADRANSRIQIFDQEGNFLAEWRQFGRPSGIFIDRNDVIYVADSQSSPQTNPGFGQGIRIGNAKDGTVTAYIPETQILGSLEATTADAAGNVYAGYTGAMNFKRFVKN